MRVLVKRFGLTCILWLSLALNVFSGIHLWKSLHSATQFRMLPELKAAYDDSAKPTVYILTATYSRLVQFAELTRMCHTLKHIENIHWVVIEDASYPSE